MSILESLWQQVRSPNDILTIDDFVVRGLWKIQLLFKPNAAERTFNYTFLLVQTTGQGCSYCADIPETEMNILGQDCRELKFSSKSLEIAALDAIYASVPKHPSEHHELKGSSIKKTTERTRIVVEEVLRCATQLGLQRQVSVVNVGVVGNFVKGLSQAGLKVFATDYDATLVGKELIDGVVVEHGNFTLDYVAKCDIALITGMTLATETLDTIIEVARQNDTKLIMFAETGANFAEALCKLGLHIVVSEPFPFYIFQGVSYIDVYRSITNSEKLIVKPLFATSSNDGVRD